ncbi:MAG: sensor histidine kinase [Bacteroidia bacterium]
MGDFSNKSFRVKLLTVCLHLAGWLALLLIPMMLHPTPRNISGLNNPEKILVWMVIFQLAHIALFYFNYHVLVPRYLLNRRYFRFLISLLVLFVMIQMIPFVSNKILMDEQGFMNRDFRRMGKFMTITFGLLLVASSTGFRLLNEWLRLEAEAKELSNEKLLAELSFLKAQIDPHFFFNTLNGIYSLSITQPEKVPNYLLRLSHFIRFVINDEAAQLISIEEEVQHLRDYVELQKLRLTDKTQIDFQVSIDQSHWKISPHLFFPFVENAIKYGISPSKPSSIIIRLEVKEQAMLFEVKNSKMRENSELGSNLIGMKNVKRRLELIYPKKHQLRVDDLPDSFFVSLQINLI